MRLQIDQDFGNSKETDHDRSQANTVAQHQNIEGEARLAGDGIEADAGEQAAEERHQQRFVHRAVRQIDQRGQTEQHAARHIPAGQSEGPIPPTPALRYATPKIATVPPIKEPKAAMPSAGPARPWRAIA